MAPRRSRSKDTSRIRTTLVVAFAIGIYLWKELKRRREQLSTLRLVGPLSPVAQQVIVASQNRRPPTTQDSRDSLDPGEPVTLQVSITRMKLRNLKGPPGDSALSQLRKLLMGELAPNGLWLTLSWADTVRLKSGVLAHPEAGETPIWPDRFVFQHVAPRTNIYGGRLQITLHEGDGLRERVLGQLALPIEALAGGPTRNDHLLELGGDMTNLRLAFRCRISELRTWRTQLDAVRLTLKPDALEPLTHAGHGGAPAAYRFSLSYIFTSGSTDQSSQETEWHAPSTLLQLGSPARDAAELELQWNAQAKPAGSRTPSTLAALDSGPSSATSDSPRDGSPLPIASPLSCSPCTTSPLRSPTASPLGPSPMPSPRPTRLHLPAQPAPKSPPLLDTGCVAALPDGLQPARAVAAAAASSYASPSAPSATLPPSSASPPPKGVGGGTGGGAVAEGSLAVAPPPELPEMVTARDDPT